MRAIIHMCEKDLGDEPDVNAHIHHDDEIAAGLRQLSREAVRLANIIDGKARANKNGAN